MMKKTILVLFVAFAFVVPTAQAASTLIAIGTLSGSIFDLSSQTSGLLEDGTAGNLLGGLGSGLAWAGGTTFVSVPDRGPNASTYNPLIDNTTSYITRFETLNLALAPNL